MEAIQSKNAPAAVGPYSQGIKTNGFLFLSGQIPLDPETGLLVDGGIEAQSERVLKNIQALLQSQGLSFSSVVKSTVFLENLDHFQIMNETYMRYFGDHKPARSTIQVAKLPKGALIEIECIAVYS